MKNINWFRWTLAAALSAGGLFLFLNSVNAQPETAHHLGGFRGQFLEKAKQKLNLTNEQTTQIKEILKGEKTTLTSLISRLHEARVGLRAAIHAPDAAEATVREASAKAATVEADLAVERLKLYKAISPILTDEQRQTLKTFEARIDEIMENAIGRIGELRAQ